MTTERLPKLASGPAAAPAKRSPSKKRGSGLAAQVKPEAAPTTMGQEDVSSPPPVPEPSALPDKTSISIDTASLLFDPDWYRSTYQDVAAAGLDPIRHFFDNGAREGRKPNPFFDTSWYLSAYADVLASKMNPFLHYLLYGAREGRRPRPDET